jgi:LuxR family maltose regulon positive regulatory protein
MDGLLTTKLGSQARGMHAVSRPRLGELLEATTAARLVLVSAPAGFGKSTALAEWLETADVRSAWLSLDRGDNDVVRFARYLTAAVERLKPGADGSTAFEAAGPFDPELALARILDPIFATAGQPPDGGSVIVLDDYHLIDEPAVHRLVTALVEGLPTHARLAIATRVDPPFPLARLRSRGELVEVRAEDLRFTTVETSELLHAAGVELAPSEVEDLTDRTEGWAAALRLAAVSLVGRPNQAELVARFGASHRFILDYVLEEVLFGLASETQEFLLRTSILERLGASLCEAVTGEPNAQARLEELDRANVLIVPLDDERRWYRYHALFAELLRARLGMLHPDEVTDLHGRASAWYEEHGDDDQAIHHALRSGNPERRNQIVADASGRHINAGELTTVRRWLDALPPEIVRQHAQLSASYAWCLVLAGETKGVAERLADADHALASGRSGAPIIGAMMPAQLAMVRSQLAGLEEDSATAIAQARLARTLVPAGLPAGVEATLRGNVSNLLGIALTGAGDLEAAAEAYQAALADLRVGGNALGVGRAIADLAGIAIARGDPAQAIRVCDTELARSDAGASAAGSGAIWAALARARAELGQFELADAAARRALELATRAGDASVVRSARSTLTRIGPLLTGAAASTPPSLQTLAAGLVEKLTTRELEVLRLVALGRSNSQVASELFVAIGTVKSHLHTIAGKLGAANRVESVARGRELGLLA